MTDREHRREHQPSSQTDEQNGVPSSLDVLHDLRVHQVELEAQNEELRRTQQQLEVARARYFDLYEMAPVGYLTSTESGLIQEANLTAAELLGQPRRVLLNQLLSRFVLPEDQDVYYQHRRRLTETRARQVSEFRVVTKGGEPHWVRLEETAVADASGALVCRAVMSDVNARKRAEDTLRDSEERHRTLFERSHDALMTLAPPDWRFTSGNSTTLALFGVLDERDLGSRPLSAYSPERQPDGSSSIEKEARMIEAAMREGSHYYEWTFKPVSGDEFPATVLLTRVEINGRALLQATVRDETSVKKLQALLSQRDRLASMGMLAAGVAHEINNPLANLLYNVETLAADLPRLAFAVERCTRAPCIECGAEPLVEAAGDDARMLEHSALKDFGERASEALESAQRIRKISRAIVTFARVESTERSRVDLNYAIKCAIAMAQNDIKFRAKLTVDFGALPAVWASEGKLSQVFLNLLINATQSFVDGDVERNQIRIRTWVAGEGVLVEIKDNGKGIAKENIGRVFEPFFTTKRVGEGSGLGLSICQNIITDFGGDLRVESEIGQGTRFVVRLPIQKGASEPPQREPAPEAPHASKVRGRVLVVDDEQLVRSLLGRMLGRDHEIVMAESGEAARTILESDSSFDVILCDLMMPGMSGMDLHEWLLTHRPALAPRVVFITGGAFTPQASDYIDRVGNAKFEKPFVPHELKAFVSVMISARRAQ